MENLYRYKIDEFHWVFTDKLKMAATIRYDLHYVAGDRAFRAQIYRRHNDFAVWGRPMEIFDEATINRLRALLPPSEIAACVAASMVEVKDADA